MSRNQLLGAASAAALSIFSLAAHAAVGASIQGGGSTLAKFEWQDEMSLYNASVAGTTKAFFNLLAIPGSVYSASGSGAGQKAFLNDDLTCDLNAVSGSGGGTCAGTPPGTTNYVDYGASDATLSATQIASWSSSSYGQSVSGNLIQLPALGVGISFPVIDSGFTANGSASLSDHDLCEIFSGGYTDFSQITDAVTTKKVKTSYAPGKFNVTYRGDSSGTSFLLTQHLAAVCKTTDTAPGFTFTATTTFASLFNASNGGGSFTENSSSLYVVTSGLTNGSANGPKGSGGVAGQLEGDGSQSLPAIGYLSPDYTTVDPNSDATVTNSFTQATGPSTLVVASALQGTTPELPTVANIKLGLDHPVNGANLNPPSTATEGANPALWVPEIAKDSAGYPVVGYTTIDIAQCYHGAAVPNGLIAFLKNHYNSTGSYASDQARNGFTNIYNTNAGLFLRTINAHILANVNSQGIWNTNIQNAKACAGLAGR